MSDNSISIRHNFPEIAKKIERMGDEVGNKAVARALNATIKQGATAMARGISKEFCITVGKAKERLKVVSCKTGRGFVRFEATMEATKRAKGRSMNLIAFVESSISFAQARKRMKAGEGGTYQLQGRTVQKALQLRFKIKRSGGAKVIPGAFIGNKGRTVFIREGKSRTPIAAKDTIDIPQMFNTHKINQAVRVVMLDRFVTNFERELRSVLKGYTK